jgi:hypothetical protein
VIHEKDWKSGSGEICDPQGEVIGLMKKKHISVKTEIQLLNPDKTIVFTISRKSLDSDFYYDVKTTSGELIGRGKKGAVSIGKLPDMYDSKKVQIYKAESGATKRSFKVIDPEDKTKIYAEIENSDKWQDIFAPEFNFKNRYVIHIVDANTPRLLLLAYAVIINDTYHDM